MNPRIPSITVLYNHSQNLKKGESTDIIAEQQVSVTAEAVEKALSSLGYRTGSLPVTWKDLPNLPRKLKVLQPDLVFNLFESIDGESQMEKNIPSLLEILQLPYTGSDSLTLGLCLDKYRTKKLLSAFDLFTPRGYLVEPDGTGSIGEIIFPVIVKPNFEDGSLGINSNSVVFNHDELIRRINYVHHRYSQAALVEEYIEGRELNISIIGNKKPIVLPFSEIDFSSLLTELPKICSYHSKWINDTPEFEGTKPICPAYVEGITREKIAKAALKTYEITGCRDYARVDIRLTPEGIPFILEINPNPDLSPEAGLTRSSAAAGIDYKDLIEALVSESARRNQLQIEITKPKKSVKILV